jgi:anti-sigma B factor antagonist
VVSLSAGPAITLGAAAGLARAEGSVGGGRGAHVHRRQGRTKATVTIAGSLDQHSSASFRACLDETLGARPTFVAVDARGLTFVDASGLAALLRAQHTATEAGVAFRVSDASPALRHVAEEAGFQALLPDE